MSEPTTQEGLRAEGGGRKGRTVALVLLCLVVVAAGVLVVRRVTRPRPVCGPAVPSPDSAYAGTDSLGRNEALAGLLERWCVPAERVTAVYAALAQTDFNFRTMRPGEAVTLLYRGLGLVGIKYDKDMVTSYLVSFDSGSTGAVRQTKPVDTVRVVVRGAIKGSLWNSLIEQGQSPALVVNYAEILSYEVDFLTETNDGDSFEILLDQYFVGSDRYRDGRIHAVGFQGRAGTYKGFYYRAPSGHWDYYNEKGQSLRKTVLRSPLTFANVTSSFGRRLHPISRVYRQHHGVDYGAPTGTPVSAIADGTVQRASWNGGYGNFVQIRHAGGLVSCYGHLSRYGAGVKSGRSVRQGQTVGYVGSTGLSTGPHLHFEVRRSGTPVNPLKVIPPRAEPVPKKYLPDFDRVKAEYLALLSRLAGPIRARPDTVAAR